jgi:glycerol-3-phosphate dehydrogenase
MASTYEFDLLVVGGGITGAGIALDAASRGLKVALVERSDFASGTSSKSSKLVHGGLRYLEQRDFGLVREAAQERDLLRQLAPHLVEAIPMVLPVADNWMRAKFGAGLWAYDALASFKNLHVHRYLGVEETESAVPAIPQGKIKGGFLFYDCKNDDVRLVMEVLVQAVRSGAVVLNHSSVVNIDGTPAGCSVTVEDGLSGERSEIRAQHVVVAAGVWTDQVESRANPEAEQRIRPSKGVHLSFRRDRLPMAEAAAFIPDAERKRMLFVIPWLDSVIVGTTDTTYEGDIDHPTVEEEDRRYCIDAVNSVFETDLTDADIAGAWAGLRPLIAGKAGSTADLSRGHAVYDIAPNVIGITGGKLTTYRRMAKDATDLVVSRLGGDTKCRTQWIRLGSTDLDALRAFVGRRAESDPVLRGTRPTCSQHRDRRGSCLSSGAGHADDRCRSGIHGAPRDGDRPRGCTGAPHAPRSYRSRRRYRVLLSGTGAHGRRARVGRRGSQRSGREL